MDTTLSEWRSKAGQICYVYDYVADKYTRKVETFVLISLILTSLAAVSSIGNIGLNWIDYPNIDIGFKIGNTLISVSAAIITSCDKIFGWTQKSQSYRKYQTTVTNFLAQIISEQTLSQKYNQDFQIFIQKHNDKFLEILTSAPEIDVLEYSKALKHYAKDLLINQTI